MAGSFFGFNLLDGFPSNRFSSSDQRSEGGGGRGLAESDSFGSFPNSPEEALTHPPAWIRVTTAHEGGAEAAATTTGIPNIADGEPSTTIDHDNDASSSFVSFSSTSIDDEDDLSLSADGVTILSSVPSSRASLPPPGLMNSAHIIPSPLTHQLMVDIDSSMLSLATTESRYVDRPMSLSSMHSSSLATSLGDLTLRSTVALDTFSSGSRDQVEADAVSLVSIPLNSTSNANEILSNDGALVVARQESHVTTHRSSSRWFSRLSTEDDWDKFHQDVLEILCAVKGEYDVADNERLLARLIQQEEAAFWNDPSDNRDAVLRRRKIQKGLVLLGNAALLVAAPVIASSYLGALRLSRR
jgi:hypothetical protein